MKMNSWKMITSSKRKLQWLISIDYDICFHVSVCQNEGQSESLIAATLNLRESLPQRAVTKHWYFRAWAWEQAGRITVKNSQNTQVWQVVGNSVQQRSSERLNNCFSDNSHEGKAGLCKDLTFLSPVSGWHSHKVLTVGQWQLKVSCNSNNSALFVLDCIPSLYKTHEHLINSYTYVMRKKLLIQASSISPFYLSRPYLTVR